MDKGEILPPTKFSGGSLSPAMKIPLFIVPSSIVKEVDYNLIIEVNIHNRT